MSLVLRELSTPEYDYICEDEIISRYMEWKITLDEKIAGSLTPEELETAPQIGLDKPNGIYLFVFDGGNLYVEVEDNQVRSISGYALDELATFDIITKEHGDALRLIYDAQQSEAHSTTPEPLPNNGE